uniref:MSP domain-containing protein n=1 Tax=Parastrongyloides trichosuri TaxID=131310 RepID=A0A0N5A7F9_PARTI
MRLSTTFLSKEENIPASRNCVTGLKFTVLINKMSIFYLYSIKFITSGQARSESVMDRNNSVVILKNIIYPDSSFTIESIKDNDSEVIKINIISIKSQSRNALLSDTFEVLDNTSIDVNMYDGFESKDAFNNKISDKYDVSEHSLSSNRPVSDVISKVLVIPSL